MTPFVLILGLTSLMGFALALTRVDSVFAGRAYAAYGGIFIAASLVWWWVVEKQTPTRTDLLGAALAIARALLIQEILNRAAQRARPLRPRQTRTMRSGFLSQTPSHATDCERTLALGPVD